MEITKEQEKGLLAAVKGGVHRPAGTAAWAFLPQEC